MSDFDERLSAVLTAEADDAPHPAGLAQAARRRHGVRRRRRIATGGLAAAVLVAAPLAVVGLRGDGGDDQVGSDPAAPAGAWQTVAQDDVRAEIPGDWRKYTCDFDGFTSEVFGPTEDDACDFRSYLAFYASATFDPVSGPGVVTGGDGASTGYVYAGDLAVSAGTDERDRTRRILASARTQGQPEVTAADWTTLHGVGMRVDVPEHWGLGPDADLGDYDVCVLPGDFQNPPDIDRESHTDEVSVGWAWFEDRWVMVSAPTDAVRDLVMTTVETTPGSSVVGCVPDRFGGVG